MNRIATSDYNLPPAVITESKLSECWKELHKLPRRLSRESIIMSTVAEIVLYKGMILWVSEFVKEMFSKNFIPCSGTLTRSGVENHITSSQLKHELLYAASLTRLVHFQMTINSMPPAIVCVKCNLISWMKPFVSEKTELLEPIQQKDLPIGWGQKKN